MFTTPNLPSLLKRVTFKLVEVPGADMKHRVADVAAVLDPFTPHLANELGEAVASHLFDEDDDPLPHVRDIRLDVPARLQRLTVRCAPELQAEAVLDEVTLCGLQVTRVEPTQGPVTYRATLALRVPLRESEAMALARLFGSEVHLTFETLQGSLFADTPDSKSAVTLPGQPALALTPDEFRRAARALREA